MLYFIISFFVYTKNHLTPAYQCRANGRMKLPTFIVLEKNDIEEGEAKSPIIDAVT